MANKKITDIENLKKDIDSLKGLKLTWGDARLGKRVALCIVEEYKIKSVVTNYMTVNEMYCFLYAIYMRDNKML